jgi:hypothetical protein
VSPFLRATPFLRTSLSSLGDLCPSAISALKSPCTRNRDEPASPIRGARRQGTPPGFSAIIDGYFLRDAIESTYAAGKPAHVHRLLGGMRTKFELRSHSRKRSPPQRVLSNRHAAVLATWRKLFSPPIRQQPTPRRSSRPRHWRAIKPDDDAKRSTSMSGRPSIVRSRAARASDMARPKGHPPYSSLHRCPNPTTVIASREAPHGGSETRDEGGTDGQSSEGRA